MVPKPRARLNSPDGGLQAEKVIVFQRQSLDQRPEQRPVAVLQVDQLDDALALLVLAVGEVGDLAEVALGGGVVDHLEEDEPAELNQNGVRKEEVRLLTTILQRRTSRSASGPSKAMKRSRAALKYSNMFFFFTGSTSSSSSSSLPPLILSPRAAFEASSQAMSVRTRASSRPPSSISRPSSSRSQAPAPWTPHSATGSAGSSWCSSAKR
ncbi:hypothetical protein TYRP_020643 [Tyrophagus putrescentiae]|nr:hypothetical protein TYRP_020643 [Tyrophagus putrescentiae]